MFNRPNQDFIKQKQSMKLILAVKKDGFLYRGTELAQDFKNKNFYYNSLILNCAFDCHYCYLQGMYQSANVVVFVNSKDFFASCEEHLERLGSIYLSISYDTDLLAFEHLVPNTSRWIDFARSRLNLSLEVRTKSAAFSQLRAVSPTPNVIFAWTLSPQTVISQFESRTPALKARLSSALSAIKAGWKVRLCFDPILAIDNWEDIYCELFRTTFSVLPAAQVYDVSLGTMRMNSRYFRKVKKLRADSPLFYGDFHTEQDSISYSQDLNKKLFDTLLPNLTQYIPRERIHLAQSQTYL